MTTNKRHILSADPSILHLSLSPTASTNLFTSVMKRNRNLTLTDDPEVEAKPHGGHDAPVRRPADGLEVHEDLRRPVGGGVGVDVLEALDQPLLSSCGGHHLDHLRHHVRHFLHLNKRKETYHRSNHQTPNETAVFTEKERLSVRYVTARKLLSHYKTRVLFVSALELSALVSEKSSHENAEPPRLSSVLCQGSSHPQENNPYTHVHKAPRSTGYVARMTLMKKKNTHTHTSPRECHTHLPGVDSDGAAHDPHGRRELAQQHHPRVFRPRGPLHLHVLQGEAVEAVPDGRVEEAVRQAQVR